MPDILTRYPAAKLPRSLGTIIYDAFLLAALQMLLLLIMGNVEGFLLKAQLPDAVRLLICYVVGAYFYVWSWTHGGKTLGMTAWKVEVRQHDGRSITPAQAWLRALSACLGLGNLWKLVDKNNMAWQDYISGTVVVLDQHRQLEPNRRG